MTDNRNRTISDILVFLLLVSIGVAGRWAQPEWCFTPTAAATVFAGWYFARLGVAALVPIAILGISDLALESHDNWGVMFFTYAVMTVPVLLGRWLRTSEGRTNTAVRLAICGLLPATIFWLVSNFAVWAFQSEYEKNWAGLVQCYWMAVPFFRWMLAGDVVYLALLLGCALLAGLPLTRFDRRLQYAPATRR